MKSRIAYGKYQDPEKEDRTVYYKRKQELTWRFYIRIIQDGQGWFTPCDKCQAMITNKWNHQYRYCLTNKDDAIVGFCLRNLCKKCRMDIHKKLKDCPVIIGNAKYEPWVELNRAWVDDEDSYEDTTKAEYDKHMLV